ncbi:hypothetical protein [Corynebacterium pygosceleis]|uniref:Uncharacterized protein n=1 Tax=Corynebacterium pygosceleis TaxID=2800406 RepID=A0A9Q4GLG5_9CORY|nr:hypothetical protein [Corynebacterium pygosceleis]MCK7636494.1 hypothetical protein [Corynebacterium pygosceleis]MCK7675068.1 hypothetical protein [Corynebacterium pygosceleis]MCL0121479.1 hypothetical protein [Corynebacterium pygosceleis]MCX7469192.1 hypothetical protein [Corynebacterium pygosceleis]
MTAYITAGVFAMGLSYMLVTLVSLTGARSTARRAWSKVRRTRSPGPVAEFELLGDSRCPDLRDLPVLGTYIMGRPDGAVPDAELGMIRADLRRRAHLWGTAARILWTAALVLPAVNVPALITGTPTPAFFVVCLSTVTLVATASWATVAASALRSHAVKVPVPF